MTRRQTALLASILVLLPTLTLALLFALFVTQPFTPPAGCLIEIPLRASLSETARRLENGGVVRSAFGFRLLARLRGSSGEIRSGEYEFTRPAPPGAILDRLVAGDVRRLRLTVPEGWTLRKIAARVDALGLGDGEEFLRLTRDPGFAASLGFKAPTLEGYLFPETYLLPKAASAERVIRAMTGEFRRRLTPELTQAAARRGLNPHQLVTLASIIQQEAGKNEEMPLISAVFHNRLRRGMPLQADPTVIYGLSSFDGNLTRQHLEAPTPYNTYRMRGLPPGPIASPGEAALRAAAFPAASNHLYFVARGDGTHAFSASLQEHNAAVRRYQLKR